MNASRAQLTAMVVAALLSHNRLARCEEPSSAAERMFQDGRAALADEDYEGARSHFEQSYKLDPTLGTLLNLAVCEEKLGKLRAALAHLQEGIDKAGPDDKRRPLIAQRLARLESRVPRLTIRPSRPLDPGVSISLDSKPLSADEIGKVLRIDPGTHVLDCAGQNGERCTIVFTVQEGQESVQAPTLSAPVTPSPPASPAPGVVVVPLPPASHGRAVADPRSMAYAAGGFGLASIAVGLIAGASVLQQKNLVAAHCDERGCDEEGIAAGQRGKALSTVSTIATGIGIVVMGASVYVLMTAPSSKGSAAGLSVAGSF